MIADEADRVAEIARGLSMAQRKTVLVLSDQWVSRMMPERVVWLDPGILETAAPLRSGHERVRLTALGMSVRTHLQDQTS